MYTLATVSKNAMLDAMGATLNGGVLRLKTSTGSVVVQWTLASPAFNTSANGSMSMKSLAAGAAVLAGTITLAEFVDSAGVVRLSGDVGMVAGATLIVLDNTNVAVAQVVTVNSITFSFP